MKYTHCFIYNFDFRANLQSSLSMHKRRENSNYMLLCDRCGYITNDKSHFNKHVDRKHPEYML